MSARTPADVSDCGENLLLDRTQNNQFTSSVAAVHVDPVEVFYEPSWWGIQWGYRLALVSEVQGTAMSRLVFIAD